MERDRVLNRFKQAESAPKSATDSPPALRLAVHLNELKVVNVREGAPATGTFDALPGVSLPGTVPKLDPIGKNAQGDSISTAIVPLKEPTARLGWTMTALITIENE